MLNDDEMGEIREHLERAQNPLFLYDNDADGLCSFLILRRAYGKGKGAAIRSYPGLDERYAKKVEELKADCVFILDKPLISPDFFKYIENLQIPIVWIDHHDSQTYKSGYNGLHVYNPSLKEKKSSEPVSYMCYKLNKRKEDLWLAVIGCISDHYFPDFAKDFAKEYPEYWAKGMEKPFDVLFKTEIGKVARGFNFGLKDSLTNVVAFQNFLINCKGPDEVFSEVNANNSFRAKYNELMKKYTRLFEKAVEDVGEKMLFFEYSGDLSISSDLANELSYRYPGRYIVVAYRNGPIANISMRGKNVKNILEKILAKLEKATGGGHEDAVGARIRVEDLIEFKKQFGEMVL